MSERPRTKNFTALEEEILLNSVGEFSHIIECRETSALKVGEKGRAWQRVAELFNSQSSVTKRHINQLKLKYKNVKANSRKRLANDKVETFVTGGGRKKILASETDARLKASGAVLRPLENVFDSACQEGS
ncbi:hypothetical protein JTE90_015732 [Oedothorax gibbosus]|uniref:Regulatory protein zeste n=1 Tax=Oedothorax gibbosus TaxID=931172 RepID=A0AAV6U0Q3_9ARAC|nr:hypothetical protein JTE90_015732 [Oedothorax gibbosus]